MKVVAQQRVMYKGTLRIKGEEFDAEDPKEDKETREFLSCRALIAKNESESDSESSSKPELIRRNYNRRDLKAADSTKASETPE